MKSALTRATALLTAYAVALQVALALVSAAAMASAASDPILCVNSSGASDQGGPQDSEPCLSACAMAGCGLEPGHVSPANRWFAQHPRPAAISLAGLLLRRAPDRLHALARAPPPA